MKHIRSVVKKEGWLCAAYIALGVLLSFLEVYWTKVTQLTLDDLSGGALSLGRIACFGGVLLLSYALGYLDELPSSRLAQRLVLDFKLLAMEKLQTVEFGFYQSLGTGLLTQRVESGAQAGKAIAFDFWFELFRSVLPSMVFSLRYIAAIDPRVVTAIACGYGLVFLLSNLLLRRLYRIKEQVLDNEELFNRRLVRALMELSCFRTSRLYPGQIVRARAEAREIERGKTRMRMVHEAFFALFALLMGLVKIGIVVYAGVGGRLSVGEVVALLALSDKAYVPVSIFNVLFVQYKLDRSAFARLAQLLDAPDEPGLLGGEALEKVRGELCLENVCLAYGPLQALRGVSLRLSPGQTIGFVGRSGSGKTTALRVAAGLQRPSGGSVRVDGRELYSLDLNSYFACIAYASQEAPVFDGSLRENLCPDAGRPDAELWQALEDCCLAERVRALPQGLDAQVGEKGALLSGGERQRLALARVLLSDAKLVLLDEATSALDNLTEERVMQRLLERLKGRTLLVAAHRLERLAALETLAVFEDGRVVQRGAYAQLVAQDGPFRRLLQAYAGGEGEARP